MRKGKFILFSLYGFISLIFFSCKKEQMDKMKNGNPRSVPIASGRLRHAPTRPTTIHKAGAPARHRAAVAGIVQRLRWLLKIVRRGNEQCPD